jgi:hypothetical protein
MTQTTLNLNSFTCPHCGSDAGLGLWKIRYYLSFWQETKCVECKKQLYPNCGTRRLIWCCFAAGFIVDIVLTWLTPWDRIFDVIYALILAIPYIINKRIFSEFNPQI